MFECITIVRAKGKENYKRLLFPLHSFYFKSYPRTTNSSLFPSFQVRQSFYHFHLVLGLFLLLFLHCAHSRPNMHRIYIYLQYVQYACSDIYLFKYERKTKQYCLSRKNEKPTKKVHHSTEQKEQKIVEKPVLLAIDVGIILLIKCVEGNTKQTHTLYHIIWYVRTACYISKKLCISIYFLFIYILMNKAIYFVLRNCTIIFSYTIKLLPKLYFK